MAVTGIGLVHLNVVNLARALEFYAGSLGFQVLEEVQGRVTLGTQDGSKLLVLHQVNNPRPRKKTTGLFHIAITLPSRADLARLILHLVNQDIELEGVADHGVSESLYLTGPDGAGLELTCDRAAADWPYDEEGGLDMGTDDLDLDDLMQTLQDGKQPFKGLPDGTKIGHVHLAATELIESDDFYINLGLNLTQVYGEQALFFAGEDYHHHLALNTWYTAGAPALAPDTAGLRFFELLYDSKDALDVVLKQLAEQGSPVEEKEDGYLVKDPSGIRVMLK